MRLLIRWIVLVIAFIVGGQITSLITDGFEVQYRSFGEVLTLFLGVALFAFLNATIGTMLRILTLPLNCLTFGIFAIVVNAIVLQIAGAIGIGFRVDNFLAALIGSVIISIVTTLIGVFVQDEKK